MTASSPRLARGIGRSNGASGRPRAPSTMARRVLGAGGRSVLTA
jgi:hypothetical protein